MTSEAKSAAPLTLTVDQAAKELSVSDDTVRREIGAGRLRHVRIRGRLVIPWDAVTEYLEAYAAGGPRRAPASSGVTALPTPTSIAPSGASRSTRATRTRPRGASLAPSSALSLDEKYHRTPRPRRST